MDGRVSALGIWLALKAKAFGNLLLELAAGAIRWLLSDWRHMAITGLALFAAWCWLHWSAEQAAHDSTAAELAEAEDHRDQWEAAYWQYRRDVWAASLEAKRMAEASAARVDAEFAAIIQETTDDYEARLARSAAAADSLQRRIELATGQRDSDSGADTVPEAISARCRAFGAADCDGLLRRLPFVLEQAQANTDKLVTLQDYVNQSLLVDFNGEGPE